MKILLGSHAFSPAIGGIESCSLALAREFVAVGHEVKIVTQTSSTHAGDDHGFTVVRRPGKRELLGAIRWCDVFFQNNISLQTLWPLAFIRKPWVVCTATWLRSPDGSVGRGNRLKRAVLRRAANVYISRAVRDHVGHPGKIIPNPYDHETFRIIPGIERKRSLVFLGRLVSDKGCDLLLQGLAQLRDGGLTVPLTIVGSGPEEALLKKQTTDLGLSDVVHFAGAMKGKALAQELNRHEIMVVPSRWEEPFGIVALEGIACGCVVVGSAGGGLPDAIGPCGITFKNNDATGLTQALRKVLEKDEFARRCREAAPEHLRCHQAGRVAAQYLELFQPLTRP